jgi:hypothetical protein
MGIHDKERWKRARYWGCEGLLIVSTVQILERWFLSQNFGNVRWRRMQRFASKHDREASENFGLICILHAE